MSNQVDNSLRYPGGHIQYAFKMHVAHDRVITCKKVHPKVKELAFEKANPSDQFDAEWLMTIHFGPVYTIEEVQEVGNEIRENVLDMLSITLNTKISETKVVGYGLNPRPGEGAIAHLLTPSVEVNATSKVGVFKLTSDDIREVQQVLSKTSSLNNKPLIRLFRYAIGAEEPVVQFMILYLILDVMNNAKQEKIDTYIMNAAPTTPQSLSPHTGKQETIYTKLRNEITHRTNVGPEITRAEITNHLDDFREIVHRAVKSAIVQWLAG